MTDEEIIAAYRATPHKRTRARGLGQEGVSRAYLLNEITRLVAWAGRSTHLDLRIYTDSSDISYIAYQTAVRKGLARRASQEETR